MKAAVDSPRRLQISKFYQMAVRKPLPIR